MTVHVRGTGQIRPTFAADLASAHQLADVVVLVGLVFRRHRGSIGMSQRAYAQWRGWSKARQARFERHPGDQRLDEVVCALRGTGYRLVLIYAGGEMSPSTPGPLGDAETFLEGESHGERERFKGPREIADPGNVAAREVVPSDWSSDEFVARDEAGRKFPAHKRVRRTTGPPLWWMFRYSTSRGLWPEWTTAE